MSRPALLFWVVVGMTALGLMTVGFRLWAASIADQANPHDWPSPGAIVTPALPGQVPGLPAVGASR